MSAERTTAGGRPERRPESDAATTERFRTWRRTSDMALRDALVIEHRGIAEACARRFADRGEPLDDLVQVALLGLVKAVHRFDPEVGVPFAGFAVPTVTGEIRRHFRDTTWAVHVPRRAKDLHVKIPATIEHLGAVLGHPPTPVEIADELGVGVEDVLDALEAGAAYRTASIDTPEGGHAASRTSMRAGFGPDGPSDDRLMLAQLLETLPERERLIVWLRFFEDLSQAEIAERVGTSQVHVSRLLRRSLRQMCERGGESGGEDPR